MSSEVIISVSRERLDRLQLALPRCDHCFIREATCEVYLMRGQVPDLTWRACDDGECRLTDECRLNDEMQTYLSARREAGKAFTTEVRPLPHADALRCLRVLLGKQE